MIFDAIIFLLSFKHFDVYTTRSIHEPLVALADISIGPVIVDFSHLEAYLCFLSRNANGQLHLELRIIWTGF